MPFFGGLNNYKISGTNNYAGTGAARELSTGLRNVLLGNQSGFYIISGSDNVIVGYNAGPDSDTPDLVDSVIIGSNAFYVDSGEEIPNAVIIGKNASSAGEGCVVIGNTAGNIGSTGQAVLIGNNCPGSDSNNSYQCVAIGGGAIVDGEKNVGIGHSASVFGDNCVAVGSYAYAENFNSVVIGPDAFSDTQQTVAVGATAFVGAKWGVAIGADSYIDTSAGFGAVAIGYATRSQVGVVIGPNLNNFGGNQTVGIGEFLTLDTEGASVIIGAGIDSADFTEVSSVVLGDSSAPFVFRPKGGTSLSNGSTAERAAGLTDAYSRYNTDDECFEFYNPTLGKWMQYGRQIDFSNTVAVVGTTTAGSATYTVRTATGTLNGDIFTFTMHFGWSAHTGTGNLQISGMPFNVAIDAGLSTLSTYVNGLAIAGSLSGILTPGTSIVSLNQTSTAGVSSGVPMDTSVANITLTGAYKIELP